MLKAGPLCHDVTPSYEVGHTSLTLQLCSSSLTLYVSELSSAHHAPLMGNAYMRSVC